MKKIRIMEDERLLLSRFVKSSLSLRGITSLVGMNIDSPDIFLLSPDAPTIMTAPAGRIRCGAAVLPGSRAARASQLVSTDLIVTYGMSGRDTVTLSSSQEEVVVAVQRELVDDAGVCVLPQEIPVKGADRYAPEFILASSALLMLSGLPPSEIGDIFS